MSDINPSCLDEALHLLGEFLEFEGAEPVRLLVVGGSALLATGTIDRSTFDLDVMARRGLVDGEILDARPLPESLVRAAAKVAQEMRLAENWINTAVALFAFPIHEYPSNFLNDLEERTYGGCLSISFLGRAGQIYLKFHAATDPERNRRAIDLEDLRKLSPTLREAREALKWMNQRSLITPANRSEIESLLDALGHETLIPIA